jgi:glutathione S-transferase
MGIKIYGHRQSTCSKRVLTTLAEKGVTDFEFVTIDLFGGEHLKPPFLNKQPFGKIPVLEDDGYLVYESRAICKYIALKYAGQGTELIPTEGDLKAYGHFEQVSYFVQPSRRKRAKKVRLAQLSKTISRFRYCPFVMRKFSNRKSPMSRFCVEVLGTNTISRRGEPDEALVKRYLDLVDINLAVYDKILSKQKYLAGDEISLADLYHLPHGVLASTVGLKEVMDRYPYVVKWFEGLQARDSWKKVNASAVL